VDLQLKGKTAVVTGGNKGIGLAIVRALVAEGVTVVGAARTVSAELADCGAQAIAVDLSTPDGPAELVRSVRAAHGDIDLLVNNVGGGEAKDVRSFFAYDDDLWRQVFDLNFFSAVRACRAAVSSVARRRGLIVNISSIGARLPGSGPVPYTTAKAALTAFSKALAEECGERGVRVVTISPGPTRTITPGTCMRRLSAATTRVGRSKYRSCRSRTPRPTGSTRST